MRITVRIQETRPRRQNCAATIAIDRASFQNNSRYEAPTPLQLGDSARHVVVEIERRILAAPGVILPIDECGRQMLPAKKCRSMITTPGVVRRNVVQGDVFQIAGE